MHVGIGMGELKEFVCKNLDFVSLFGLKSLNLVDNRDEMVQCGNYHFPVNGEAAGYAMGLRQVQ